MSDTNEDEIFDIKPKNSNKRKSDDSSDGHAFPAKKTKTEVFRIRSVCLLVRLFYASGDLT